jgi:polyisoprenoid-binding protein YceI
MCYIACGRAKAAKFGKQHAANISPYLMKLNLPLAVVLGFASFVASLQAADTYNIDPNHSTVGFAVNHMVINTVHGKFDEFTGSVTLDNNALQAGTATIQPKSINTGIERRDNHLKSPDFFDAAKYPTITFQSKRAEKKGDETILAGDFTMHGVTKEISLPVTIKGPIKDPWGNTRIGIEAKTKLSRKDYGLKYNQMLETGGMVVGDEVEIQINAEAVKAAAK